MLVEIVEWESVEAREALRKKLEATDTLAPVFALLAAPIKDIVIAPLR